MRLPRVVAAGFAALVVPAAAIADDIPAKGKIVGVDLFKNGLAVVKCEVTLGKAGDYLLGDVPQPVHGTFSIDGGTAKVEAAMKMTDVEVPVAEAGIGSLQDDLAGKKVTIQLKGANRPPVVGTMMKLKHAKGEQEAAQRFLVVQTSKGRVYVDPTEVSSVEVDNAGDTVKRRQPRLVLTLSDTDKPETKVTMRYLTNGLSWAPSYRIDITDPKTLTLEQNAVIKNELASLDGAEVRLISGYPNVQYSRVRSLLGPKTTWATFFAEISSRYGGFEADGLSNSVAMQQSIGNFRNTAVGTALGATPTGEGVDLHYQPIGKRTIADGDVLSLTVAKGKAGYQRIVEWTAGDPRDEYGRYANHGRADEDAWDALKFKNPLTFPMSTGPATVTAGGSFNGQHTTYWVNPGEETVLRVEKALSVRTRAIENEAQAKGEVVWVGSRQYRKVTVEGELAINNNRKESIQLVIRRRFSGELVKAEGEPKTGLLVEGVYSVNKRNELVWTLPLKGGEEKSLKYSYTVLVLNGGS